MKLSALGTAIAAAILVHSATAAPFSVTTANSNKAASNLPLVAQNDLSSVWKCIIHSTDPQCGLNSKLTTSAVNRDLAANTNEAAIDHNSPIQINYFSGWKCIFHPTDSRCGRIEQTEKIDNSILLMKRDVASTAEGQPYDDPNHFDCYDDPSLPDVEHGDWSDQAVRKIRCCMNPKQPQCQQKWP
jgi:hypothetical protein